MTIQFVCFETTLDSEQFISRWEQYKKSLDSNADVILQQSVINGKFKYIAQHHFAGNEINLFDFKEEKKTRIVQVKISTIVAGGYSLLQEEMQHGKHAGSKVFVFLKDATTDLDIFRKLSVAGKLNIYEAYYENCKYAYILEYFINTKNAAGLLDNIMQQQVDEAGIYKICILPKNFNNDIAEKNFDWSK